MTTALSSIITEYDYYGCGQWYDHPDNTSVVKANVAILLDKVNTVLQLAINDGVNLKVNPVTGSYVSGAFHGLGGFRPGNATQGATGSSHKEGKGVDIADVAGDLDAWCMKNQAILRKFGLYIEHPDVTPHWCHFTTRAPKSGNTIFHP